jgi:transcriptional regulator with XRE-family HTH domain
MLTMGSTGDRRRMDRLAELRERRALTLRELSDISGVAADTINQIELGHRKARPSTLRKLAKALDVNVRQLFEEPALSGKDDAPRDAGLLAKEESIFDLAHDAIVRQHRADTQASNRAESAEGIRQPARFQEYENALATVLLGRDPSEVVGEFIELMHGYVRLERRVAQTEEENARLRGEAERESVHQ